MNNNSLQELVEKWRGEAEDPYENSNGPNYAFSKRECADELEEVLENE